MVLVISDSFPLFEIKYGTFPALGDELLKDYMVVWVALFGVDICRQDGHYITLLLLCEG